MQLRINFTCIFKVFKLASSLRDSGNFVKTLKILVKLILNCPRAHAITYTNCTLLGPITITNNNNNNDDDDDDDDDNNNNNNDNNNNI